MSRWSSIDTMSMDWLCSRPVWRDNVVSALSAGRWRGTLHTQRWSAQKLESTAMAWQEAPLLSGSHELGARASPQLDGIGESRRLHRLTQTHSLTTRPLVTTNNKSRIPLQNPPARTHRDQSSQISDFQAPGAARDLVLGCSPATALSSNPRSSLSRPTRTGAST